MNILEELVKGRSGNAIYLTVIGSDYRKKFEEIALPYYEQYCNKYDLGLLILNDYVDSCAKQVHPYSLDPGYQRLLIPQLIANHHKNYKFVADMDADCIPGPVARNIFLAAFTEEYCSKQIFFTLPVPNQISRSKLGRRISLLRKMFHDDRFPLDSLLAGDDDFEKKALGFNFDGPIATLGTCVGHVDLMAYCGKIAYDEIANNFSGYLQNYRNKIYRQYASIKWLPYEFQAIWNYEVALYYPFLYLNPDSELAYECVQSTLMRVDMLHFAGAWPENKIFFRGPFNKGGTLKTYFEKLQPYLDEEISLKSYGRLKFLKN